MPPIFHLIFHLNLRIRPVRFSLTVRATALAALLTLLGACASPGGMIQRNNTSSTAAPILSGPMEPGQQELVFQALALLGVPYKNGGSTPETGFDCSGLVRYVFHETTGLSLPHSAEEIGRRGDAITSEQLQPGDLVFYNTQGKSNSHVGIYLGDGRFIHAPSERGVVRIENMALPYWTQRYDGARRIG